MIVNLTPHIINVFGAGDVQIAQFERSGHIARLDSREVERSHSYGCPTVEVVYGDINLGGYTPRNGDTVIVAILMGAAVKAAYPFLTVLSPNTGPGPNGAVRDAAGQLCGCRSFIRY